MNPIKIISVFGTRPEAIKMAPLIKLLAKEVGIFSIVVSTAQHRNQLDQVLNFFDIEPDYDLNIMKENQTLEDINIAILTKLSPIIKYESPDLILVHGDASTSFVGALCAFYNKIPIGHVEAGLRSGDKYQPFPEEVNRKLISNLADLHFAPTSVSKNNLIQENITKNIFVTGNTAIDAISFSNNYIFKNETLNSLDYTKKIVLLTTHRRENFGNPIVNICDAVIDLVNNIKNIHFVCPVHQNPNVKKIIETKLGNNTAITLTEPLNIGDIHNLIARSYIVLTDSGGIQEEAPHLNVPVIVLRNVTERPEGLKANVLTLAGIEKDTIYNAVSNLMLDKKKYDSMANGKNPFGDGNASKRIVQCIKYYFNLTSTPPKEFI